LISFVDDTRGLTSPLFVQFSQLEQRTYKNCDFYETEILIFRWWRRRRRIFHFSMSLDPDLILWQGKPETHGLFLSGCIALQQITCGS